MISRNFSKLCKFFINIKIKSSLDSDGVRPEYKEVPIACSIRGDIKLSWWYDEVNRVGNKIKEKGQAKNCWCYNIKQTWKVSFLEGKSELEFKLIT